MAVKTSNTYGNISISNKAIAKFVSQIAMDCYGIVELQHFKFFDLIVDFFKNRSVTRGVKIQTVGDRIFIDVCVVIKYGVYIKAVAESLKESVKYKVERFTGMIVDTVNVSIVGVKL